MCFDWGLLLSAPNGISFSTVDEVVARESCCWVKFPPHFLSPPRVCLFGVVALVISWVSLGLEFAVSAVSFCITA